MNNIDRINKYQKYNVDDIYDNNLKKIRIERGFTIRQLSELCELSLATIGHLELAYLSPFKSNGEIRPYISKICQVLECPFEELFPRDICNFNNDFEIISIFEITEVLSYDQNMTLVNKRFINQLLIKFLKDNKSKNTFKHFKIMYKYYYYGYNFEELGKIYGVTRSRIQQIVSTCIKKIRNWVNETNYLKGEDFYD